MRGGGSGGNSSNNNNNNNDNNTQAVKAGRRAVDWVAVVKYGVGMTIQVSLLYGLLAILDQVTAQLPWKIPTYVHAVFFYIWNANTGKCSPLLRGAVAAKTTLAREQTKKQTPAWTPPGWVFAVMWPLFVFGLRAVTASMIVRDSHGILATPAILSLQFHLAFGNLWNTINRVEQRLGASVPALYGLLFSNLYASYRFALVNPWAGKLLAATSIWLAAAAALETHVWLLNPDAATGQPEPLYPAKDPKWNTQFQWER